MEESTEAKDIEAKYKAKAEEMGAELKAEAAKFEAEAASFKKNAMANGQAWAQQKGAELQQREQQLQYAQQGMMQQLQGESGTEMDSLVKKYKKCLKITVKKKGTITFLELAKLQLFCMQKTVTMLLKMLSN